MGEVTGKRTATLMTAVFSLCVAVSGASAQQLASDTLPPFKGVLPMKADSTVLIEAASDALQGRSSVNVPMTVLKVTREARSVVIELAPLEDGRVKWINRGGKVRILADGRRVVISRK